MTPGEDIPRLATGMVLGKMMPPHAGHRYLIGCARRQVERLAVVVEKVDGEPIPSELRVRWMRELFPMADIVHLDQLMPQDPSEHEDFWRLWREQLQRCLPYPPDAVFASEDYGHRLAAELGARFLPVDPRRQVMPVSATQVRADPGAWRHVLPAPVQAYYGLESSPVLVDKEPLRVALIGPESTGKTRLAQRLAEAFCARYVPEHAHTLIAAGTTRGRDLILADLEDFTRGQRASEDELASYGGRVLFCDSDALTTRLYAESLFGGCPPWIAREATTTCYALTLLLAPDVPWVDDVHRIDHSGREIFFQRCDSALSDLGRAFIILRGGWEQRFERASLAVATLL